LPAPERRGYLERACADDPDLVELAWKYVQWEEQMGSFLLDPLCTFPEDEKPFIDGQLYKTVSA
jgi:hypothetical protein